VNDVSRGADSMLCELWFTELVACAPGVTGGGMGRTELSRWAWSFGTPSLIGLWVGDAAWVRLVVGT
jgi:hypothetical protein